MTPAREYLPAERSGHLRCGAGSPAECEAKTASAGSRRPVDRARRSYKSRIPSPQLSKPKAYERYPSQCLTGENFDTGFLIAETSLVVCGAVCVRTVRKRIPLPIDTGPEP